MRQVFEGRSSLEADRLISPTINLAGNSGTHLKFYHAYAPYGQGLDDGLRVEISGTCGQIWNTIYEESGAGLGTAPTSLESWTPTTASQWELHDIDLSIWDGQRIVIRFTGINGFGNNLYLDHIQIAQSGVLLSWKKTSVSECFQEYLKGCLFLGSQSKRCADSQVCIVELSVYRFFKGKRPPTTVLPN